MVGFGSEPNAIRSRSNAQSTTSNAQTWGNQDSANPGLSRFVYKRGRNGWGAREHQANPLLYLKLLNCNRGVCPGTRMFSGGFFVTRRFFASFFAVWICFLFQFSLAIQLFLQLFVQLCLKFRIAAVQRRFSRFGLHLCHQLVFRFDQLHAELVHQMVVAPAHNPRQSDYRQKYGHTIKQNLPGRQRDSSSPPNERITCCVSLYR